MIMSWIFTGIAALSLLFAAAAARGQDLSAAMMQGAQNGITLAVSLAGSLCLWSGIGNLMEKIGLTDALSRLLRPLLHRLFPSTKADKLLAGTLSANICANFLGLGNAATPMGIRSVRRMLDPLDPKRATDEMCRLVVLNTASIQLIPATVASVRLSLGCRTPFDILPAVWLTSLCAVTMGLLAAFFLRKLWKNG